MLVGPQCAGVEGANLFAMNEAGTDKVLFTNADQNEVGIYLNNVSTKYVVALPVKKDEMLVDIYNKGNIDQIESASKHNSVKFFKRKTICNSRRIQHDLRIQLHKCSSQ